MVIIIEDYVDHELRYNKSKTLLLTIFWKLNHSFYLMCQTKILWGDYKILENNNKISYNKIQSILNEICFYEIMFIMKEETQHNHRQCFVFEKR